MLKSFCICLLLLWSCNTLAQHSLQVKVTNIKKIHGQVQICLFKDGIGFLSKGKPIECEWIDVNSSSLDFTFDSIVAGEYAVIVIHDLNDNQDLDTNFIGIPSEPYGFSNNPSTTFGPPDFEEASFKMSQDMKIEVKLR